MESGTNTVRGLLSSDKTVKDLGIMNSSSVISISLETVQNMRSLTFIPCIFNTIYTYGNEIQTIQGKEDRQ